MADKLQQKRSELWIHFSIISDGKAKCNLCSGTYSYRGGNTSNLKKHLKTKHPVVLLNEPVEKKIESDACSTTSASISSLPSTSSTSLLPSTSSTSLLSFTSSKSKKQTSLSSFLSRPISLSRQNKINLLILNMIIKDLQPFSIVQDRGFRELLKELEPSYEIPSRNTFTKSLLQAQYAEKVQSLKSLLAKTNFVALTTDGWTSINTESYICITAHFITDFWEFHSCLLSCVKYDERHTAENLCIEIKRVVEEWEITPKICAVTTDNAHNIVNAIKLCEWSHIPCFAHTINLVVREAIKHIGDIQTKIKRIVEYFHKSPTANTKLQSVQIQLNPDSPPLKLINDVGTRWNSTFYMFERVIKLSEAVCSTLGVLRNPVELPTEEEWFILEELCKILKPFEQVTVEMSSEQAVTLSKVILIVRGLSAALKTIESSVTKELSKNLIQILQESMARRFDKIELNTILAKSSFLDPRFKTKSFTSKLPLEKVKEKIQGDVVRLINKEKHMSCDNNTLASASHVESENLSLVETDIIWQDFDDSVKSNASNIISPTAIAINEIRMFCEDGLIGRKENPLVWWKARESIYPRLAEEAKQHLCIVATSVPSERMFSKAGQILTERRNRLKATNVNKILFLHFNQDI